VSVPGSGEWRARGGAWSRGDRSAWAYVSGLVAARMGRLLEGAALRELLRLKDGREVVARARQSLLGDGLSAEGDWLGVGDGIDEAFRQRVAEMGRDCPDGTVTDFFGLQEECRLLKRAAKARLAPGSAEEVAPRTRGVGSGEARPAEPGETAEGLAWESPLVEAERTVQGLVSDREAAEEAVPWLIDLVYDGALLRSEVTLAEALADRWQGEGPARIILGWVELQSLLVVARAGRWPEPQKSEARPLRSVAQYFGSPGGAAEWLLPLYEVEEVDPALLRLRWQATLQGVLGGALVDRAEAAASPAEGTGVAALEEVARRGDEVLMEWVQGLRWVPFGPEPVFGYLWGLRAEADNLKAVVGGVSAGVSPTLIGEQLRPTYG